MSAALFQPGITRLATRGAPWVRGRRLALLSHPAAMNVAGASSAQLLREAHGARLAALFGPEHGYFGSALAGAAVASERHPDWGIPVYSLYGEQRRPTPEMLRGIETVVVDLQDIGARCYTYVSTLRLVLEAAAGSGTRVVVADRPIPLPSVVDGPVTDPAYESFVAMIPAPLQYGLTPAEAALWLRRKLALAVELDVAPMRGYRREPGRLPGWPPWMPPSPGIESWASGQCYTATVFTEAMPHIDHARGTGLAFQAIGAPWLKADAVAERLRAARLPGLSVHVHRYVCQSAAFRGERIPGVRLTPTDPDAFRPVTTSVHLVAALQSVHGKDRIWKAPGTRPEWFDKLYGTDRVRRALLDGAAAADIAASWQPALRRFRSERKRALLYRRERGT